MRVTLIFATLFCVSLSSTAQIDPVEWSINAQKINDGEYDVVFTAKIDDGWSVYSQYLESDAGPIPTSIAFDEENGLQLIGKSTETGVKKEGFDQIFGMNLVKFSKMARITQRVKITGTPDSISGFLTFMTCDDQSCLPPKDVDFDISLHMD